MIYTSLEIFEKARIAGYDKQSSCLHHINDWIREKGMLYVDVGYDHYRKEWYFKIHDLSAPYSTKRRTIVPKDCLKNYKSFEDALSVGVEKSLDAIIQKNRIS